MRPQKPENVGFVARSMKAFGFPSLALVDPQFGWDETSPAYKTASGSDAILRQARVFTRVKDAVAECQSVVGFSRRTYRFPRTAFLLDEWISEIRQSGTVTRNTALLFGSEDFGLSNEDKQLCDTLVEIPCAMETLSLNLSHAVTLVLYELFSRALEPSTSAAVPSEPIPREKVERLVSAAAPLIQSAHPQNAERVKRHEETFRNILYRKELTPDEYSVLMGLFQTASRMKKTTELSK